MTHADKHVFKCSHPTPPFKVTLLMWVDELPEVWKRTFNRQQRVQNSQAAAVTALSRLIRSEVRFQPTLPSLHLPRTHSVQHTLAPDRFSGTNLSSMLHRHYHTPPTHCTPTLYSMCVQLHACRQRERKHEANVQKQKQTWLHKETGNDREAMISRYVCRCSHVERGVADLTRAACQNSQAKLKSEVVKVWKGRGSCV